MKKFLFSLFLLTVGMIAANAFTSNDVGYSLLRTETNVHIDVTPVVPAFEFCFLNPEPPKSSPVYNGYGLALFAGYADIASPLLLSKPNFINLNIKAIKKPFITENLYLLTTGSLRYC